MIMIMTHGWKLKTLSRSHLPEVPLAIDLSGSPYPV
jgi:hypothetical protein